MPRSFEPNDPAIHPHHGLGRVVGITTKEVDGRRDRYLVVNFSRSALTLSIPEARLAESGLRPLSSKRRLLAALALISDPPAAVSGHWASRSADYTAKLNSGRPERMAELLRDIGRSGGGGAGSRLRAEALCRLAEEMSAVSGMPLEQERAAIEERLRPDPGDKKRSGGGTPTRPVPKNEARQDPAPAADDRQAGP